MVDPENKHLFKVECDRCEFRDTVIVRNGEVVSATTNMMKAQDIFQHAVDDTQRLDFCGMIQTKESRRLELAYYITYNRPCVTVRLQHP
jgi:hypothetical protein